MVLGLVLVLIHRGCTAGGAFAEDLALRPAINHKQNYHNYCFSQQQMHATHRSSRPAAALHESSKLRRPAAPLLAPCHRVQPFRSIPPGHEDRHGRRVSLLKCASATANTSALNSLPAPDAAAAVAAAAESGQTLALSRRASLVLATLVVLGSSGPWRRGAAHAEGGLYGGAGKPGEGNACWRQA